MSTTVPPIKTVLNDIISALAALPVDPVVTAHQHGEREEHARPSNPLKNASPSTKSLLLTLHVLYPQETLPALDLLDRNLVSRLIWRPGGLQFTDHSELHKSERKGEIPQLASTSRPQDRTMNQVLYLVRSSQNPSSGGRFRDSLALSTRTYEVRLQAWNCSCPAFAFSAFPPSEDAPPTTGTEPDESFERPPRPLAVNIATSQLFGGLAIKPDPSRPPPLCKHLLACLLADSCPIFRDFVEERLVSREEMAGWCAGYGE